ncbi:aldose 1-epimerase family protein [Spiroplasma chinense]|uniref:Aldose 1-epimerase family protein n=1 Tax=Spiroplasma chinense TaxID=216932 RepID=A0A5B9Y4I7_9MOLU|nr:hypothetical protein [Spiroplasma chinense]QEH61596.1 aldose 1-epimerase family protein [Spiroplasma chinense]
MYELKNDILEAKFEIEEKGLEIRSLKHKGKELLYQQDEDWAKNFPVLFPVCGYVKGKFTYKGSEYEVPRHGFFKDIKNWKVNKVSDTLFELTSKPDETIKKMYPFDYELKAIIEIDGNRFKYNFEIKNDGENEMYFSFGHHPAFLMSSDSELVFDKPQKYVTENGVENSYVPNQENKIEIAKFRINDYDFSDSKFFLFDEFNGEKVIYNFENKQLEFDFKGYPYLVLWKMSEKSNFFCIEPWYGVPDNFELESREFKDKIGIQKLEKGQSKLITFEFSINDK